MKKINAIAILLLFYFTNPLNAIRATFISSNTGDLAIQVRTLRNGERVLIHDFNLPNNTNVTIDMNLQEDDWDSSFQASVINDRLAGQARGVPENGHTYLFSLVQNRLTVADITLAVP